MYNKTSFYQEMIKETIYKVMEDLYYGISFSKRNVTESSFELVYSIGEGILDKAAKENQMDISEKLIKIDGVKRVNVVDQKDELSQ